LKNDLKRRNMEWGRGNGEELEQTLAAAKGLAALSDLHLHGAKFYKERSNIDSVLRPTH
jgi:hypothetical protein